MNDIIETSELQINSEVAEAVTLLRNIYEDILLYYENEKLVQKTDDT